MSWEGAHRLERQFGQVAQEGEEKEKERRMAGFSGMASGEGGPLARGLTRHYVGRDFPKGKELTPEEKKRKRERLKGGAQVGRALDAMGRQPEGVNKTMGRMAERERDWKQMNDKNRNEWKKNLMKGDVKGAINKFKNRQKKLKTARYEHHGLMIWAVLIGMAIFKDLLDIGTVELISWIDWIIDALIGLTFYLVLGSKKLSFETRLVRSLIPAIMEMIPGIGIVPVWTFSIMYIYFRSEIATALPAKPEEKKLPG